MSESVCSHPSLAVTGRDEWHTVQAQSLLAVTHRSDVVH